MGYFFELFVFSDYLFDLKLVLCSVFCCLSSFSGIFLFASVFFQSGLSCSLARTSYVYSDASTSTIISSSWSRTSQGVLMPALPGGVAVQLAQQQLGLLQQERKTENTYHVPGMHE